MHTEVLEIIAWSAFLELSTVGQISGVSRAIFAALAADLHSIGRELEEEREDRAIDIWGWITARESGFYSDSD